MTTTEPAAGQVPSLEATPGDPDGTTQSEDSGKKSRKRPRGGVIAIVVLSIALASALAALALYLIKLDDADSRIGEQQRQLEEQRVLIEKKATFGAAMEDLMDAATEFDGVLLSSLVPLERYQAVASQAWSHRWNSKGLDRDLSAVRNEMKDLEVLLTAATAEGATNSTGTTYEAVIDQLGSGFVTSAIDDADALCDADVLACVSSASPRTVHFDIAGSAEPYMTDWLRTGVAYHEFAHVLQLMNPAPTETALAAFGGDDETMADCFALSYLDGWTLDHRIWMNRYDYWDVDIGYGHVCDDAQKQSVRDWYGQLGFRSGPITQQG